MNVRRLLYGTDDSSWIVIVFELSPAGAAATGAPAVGAPATGAAAAGAPAEDESNVNPVILIPALLA
ncbi:hypothetical protein D3C87_1622170 [compost metagenome]